MSLKRCYRAGSEEGRPGWRIAFPFDEAVLERLESAIPWYDRQWHPRPVWEWWIAAEHEATLRRLFADFGLFADAPRLL
ncbi:MAG: hypothetical protein ABIH03_01075 [Pseudomonadota bacterium]